MAIHQLGESLPAASEKFVILRGDSVTGPFDNYALAIEAGREQYRSDSFVVLHLDSAVNRRLAESRGFALESSAPPRTSSAVAAR